MTKENMESRVFPRRKTLTNDMPREDAPQAAESEEKKEVEEVVAPKEERVTGHYSAFGGATFIDALTRLGEDSSFEFRAKIAKANGIPNYYGRPDQNDKLLALASKGELKRP